MMHLSSCGLIILFLTVATSGTESDLQSTAEVVDENSRKLATANNDLAVNIYRQITTDSDGNVFFSPLSLSSAFGVLYYGTRGDTAEELRAALGYDRADLEDSLVHQTFQKYLTETLPSQDSTAYTLNSANAVLLSQQLDLVPNYTTEVLNYYQASVEHVDFATQGPQVVSQINNWVQEKTNGKIDKLLDELDPATIMVLLNAVYFKGSWETEFDPQDTHRWNFYNNGLRSGKTKTAMMFLTDMLRYVEADDTKVLELPYKGDNISMVILLPNEMDGLESLERSMTAAKISQLRSQMVKKEVHLAFPKFKLEYSVELSGAFQAIGANKVFTPAADFSGVTTSDGVIAVSQVLHKAVIEVNEEGSEASALTGIVTTRTLNLNTVFFSASHPFLFAIIDRRNDMILFMGRVTNL